SSVPCSPDPGPIPPDRSSPVRASASWFSFGVRLSVHDTDRLVAAPVGRARGSRRGGPALFAAESPCVSGNQAPVSRGTTLTVAAHVRGPIIGARYGLPRHFARYRRNFSAGGTGVTVQAEGMTSPARPNSFRRWHF